MYFFIYKKRYNLNIILSHLLSLHALLPLTLWSHSVEAAQCCPTVYRLLTSPMPRSVHLIMLSPQRRLSDIGFYSLCLQLLSLSREDAACFSTVTHVQTQRGKRKKPDICRTGRTLLRLLRCIYFCSIFYKSDVVSLIALTSVLCIIEKVVRKQLTAMLSDSMDPLQLPWQANAWAENGFTFWMSPIGQTFIELLLKVNRLRWSTVWCTAAWTPGVSQQQSELLFKAGTNMIF